jgi:hypothetical protein
LKKKGTVTRPKTLFHVWGRIVSSNHTFNEFVCAYSEAQAKLIVHRRLEARHRTMADIQLEYRGVKVLPQRPRLSGMLPEVDANYPCTEGCGGGPEFIPEKSEPKRRKPKTLRRAVRDRNLSLF